MSSADEKMSKAGEKMSSAAGEKVSSAVAGEKKRSAIAKEQMRIAKEKMGIDLHSRYQDMDHAKITSPQLWKPFCISSSRGLNRVQ